jgi:OOP family OmpA-OmpF porin
MKKLNKVAMLFASAALVTAAGAQTVDNWKNGTNELTWKSGAGDLCWRDANWTPASAVAGCDGAIAPKVAAPVVVAPVAPVVTPAPVAPKVVPVAPVGQKMTYASDAFYDTGKAVLKPAGKEKLDDLVGKIKGMNLEVVVATGHTDAVGGDASNQKLSIRRAESVKAYLVSKGIEKNRIYTEGKGEKQPVADNKTAEGRAKNRRVEIEVVGTPK